MDVIHFPPSHRINIYRIKLRAPFIFHHFVTILLPLQQLNFTNFSFINSFFYFYFFCMLLNIYIQSKYALRMKKRKCIFNMYKSSLFKLYINITFKNTLNLIFDITKKLIRFLNEKKTYIII